MKEKLKQFVAEKRAVSPVIGVVLMVAVVVILAAVIGAFVLGLGGSQQDTPQASFSYDAAAGTLTHAGGDTLDGANVYVVADGTRGAAVGGQPAAGEVVATGLAPTESLVVVYDDGEGTSATLWSTDIQGGGGGGAGG